MSQTIRNTAKTTPTSALAKIIFAGMPKTKKATAEAAIRPANADRPAETRPEAKSPSKTRTGNAAAVVEITQFPIGS
jgi:hypothetical protein